MVTSLKSSKKDRFCIASRLWLYCSTPAEQTERLSSLLAYEAEEKDYDAPEQPERRQVSSALAD